MSSIPDNSDAASCDSDGRAPISKVLNQIEDLVKYEANKRISKERGELGEKLVSEVRLYLFELLEENRSLRKDLEDSVDNPWQRSYRDAAVSGVQPPSTNRVFTPNVKNKSVLLNPTTPQPVDSQDANLKKIKDALDGLEIIRIKPRQQGIEVITSPSTAVEDIQSKLVQNHLPFTAGVAPKLQPEVLIFTGDYQEDIQNLPADIKTHNPKLDPSTWHTVRSNDKITIYRMNADQRKELISRGGCFVKGQKLKCKDVVTVRVCLTCGKAHANPANCKTKPEDRICVRCCGKHSLKPGECPIEGFPDRLKCCLCGLEGHTPFRGDNSCCHKTNELKQRKVNMTDYGDGPLPCQNSQSSKASVYIHHNLSHLFAVVPSISSDESIMVTSSNLCVCSFYIPPGSDDILFLWQLSDALLHRGDVILAGDCNGYHDLWGVLHPERRNGAANRTGNQVAEFMDACLLNCANDTINLKPTYKHVASATDDSRESIVVITLYGSDTIVRDWYVSEEESLSDHFIISFKAGPNNQEDPYNTSVTGQNALSDLCFSRTNWEMYHDFLAKNPLDTSTPIRNEETISLRLESLRARLQEAARAATPKKKPPRQRKDKQWWDDDCRQARANLKRQERLYGKGSEEYKASRTTYRELIDLKKSKGFETFANRIEMDMNFLKKVKSPARLGPSLLIGDSSPYETVERLSDTYLGSKEPPQAMPWPILSTSSASEAHITAEEVESILRSRRKNWNKASGEDGLRLRHLAETPHWVITELAGIYTACINFGFVPNSFKSALVCFLPKGKNEGKINSVRPISLLSVIGKLCEAVVGSKLQSMVDMMLNSDMMFGYLPNRSTSRLVNRIRKDVSGKKVWSIAALDCSNAFGNIKHESILNSLVKHDVHPALCNWIMNWLSGRVNHAHYLGVSTYRYSPGDRGTPQGAILSPLLFNIVCFDTLSELQRDPIYDGAGYNVNVLSYADDSFLVFNFRKGLPINEMDETIRACILCAGTYLDRIGLALSMEKTEVLTSYNSRCFQSQSIRILGVTLPKSLSGFLHLREGILKCQRTLGSVLRYVRKNYGLSVSAMLRIFDVVIVPTLTYALSCYGSTLFEKRSQKLLDQFQAKYLKSAYRISHFSATREVLALSGRHPLSVTLRDRACIEYLHNKDFRECLLLGVKTPVKKKFTAYLCEAVPEALTREFEVYGRMDGKDEDCTRHVRLSVNRSSAIELANARDLSKYRIYTDGSLCCKSNTAGAAFVVMDSSDLVVTQKYWRLPDHSTIAQCEIAALLEALKYCRRFLRPGEANIFTDSSSALLSICSTVAKDPLNLIRDLIKETKSMLCWIPSHSDEILGNDLADKAANVARSLPTFTPVARSKANAKRLLLVKMNGNLERDLLSCKMPVRSLLGSHHQRRLVWSNADILPPVIRVLLNRSKSLGSYRHRLGMQDSPLCPYCDVTDDGQHKIMVCPIIRNRPAWHNTIGTVGQYSISLERLKSLNLVCRSVESLGTGRALTD
ncbi:hypothetical protein FOL47_000881 [Perkinsus chesapeaki]|uniref:Uncharacterized protein n=1 Tax=Perkinsus chesapeaki TaxID=330153 RepID=A0A7J6KU53_PERCH|nr:hypothetical protein FOL47_000881 [Perkinsus chesapeaki]